MSGNPNRSAAFPVGKLLAAFVIGSGVSAACMAGLAFVMVKQGLSQSAAGPMATCAVSAGSLFSGWLMAFWQKSRGLFCGIVQGFLFGFLLLLFGLFSGNPPEELQIVRFGCVLLFGCIGGILGMLRAEKRRHT